MEKENKTSKSAASRIKANVSEKTKTLGATAGKAIKSTKSVLSDVVSSESLKGIGSATSKTAKTIVSEASDKIKSTKSIMSDSVLSEKLKDLGEKASGSADGMISEVYEKVDSVKKVSIDKLKKAGDAASDMANLDTIKSVGKSVSGMATLEHTKGAVKYASGVKGYKELKQAKEKKRNAEEKIQKAIDVTEKKKDDLNRRIDKYAAIKLAAIENSICVFVEYLQKIGQKNKGKAYEALHSIDVKKKDIADMQDLGISTVNLAKGAAGSSLVGAVALLGTKAAVMQGVVAFASASTGTAISGLSGAAATNATLAFLGGGSIASGGGGMAAGAMVLGGITAGAFLAVGALSGGILLSVHGSRALTMATKYAADVDKGVATLEKSWAIMDGIAERVNELEGLTVKLEKRAIEQLKQLAVFVPDFDPKNIEHQKVFQKTALLMKSMSELTNTPLIDEKGCVTEDSGIVAGKIRSILST